MTAATKILLINIFIAMINIMVTMYIAYCVFSHAELHGGPIISYFKVVFTSFFIYAIMHIFGDRIINEYKRSINYLR